jgi:uncharacterized protein (DUF736 family)
LAGLGSTKQEVGAVRRRKRSERGRKAVVVNTKPTASDRCKPHQRVPDAINATLSKRTEEGRDYLPLKLAASDFGVRIYNQSIEEKGRRITSDAPRL